MTEVREQRAAGQKSAGQKLTTETRVVRKNRHSPFDVLRTRG